MNTITLYIGSNNVTHEVDKNEIVEIVSAQHQGFTISDSIGYWLGKPEKSVVVTISDDKNKILETINQLKIALNQDAIAYSVASGLQFI